MKENHCTQEKRKKYILWGMLIAFVILTSAWIIWANKALECSEIFIYSDRLPKGFDGYCIAQISDLHNAEFGENNDELVQMLEKAQPDMIVLTGDLVDSSHTDFDVAVSFVQQAVRIAPTYYVTGNHEAWLDQSYEILESQLKACGVHVMRDEALFIEREDDRILLMGLDDPEFYVEDHTAYDGGAAQMARIIEPLRFGYEDFSILLSHRPELFDTYVNCQFDLVFTGHAHGGQFRLPLIGGLVAPDQGLFPEYDAGLYEKSETCMIVSRGLGNSIIPLRIGNRPEIVIAKLHCSGE